MKYTRKSARTVALSVKPIAAGVFVFVLLIFSLALMFFGKNRSGILDDVRMAIADTAAPVVEVLARPMDTFHNAGNWLHEMASLHEENLRLKADNDRLLRWQTVATELGNENDRLKSLLKFAPAANSSYISARIAIDAGSAYSRSVVIGAGANHGVIDDSAVVNENGLVGRVVEVGQKTTRVLLLTDINSRIPVIAETSREHAIAGGTGADALSLMYLPENSKIKVGETIVTSGDGSVLPAGLPVGVVTKIDKGVASVQMLADLHRLDYVSVVDFKE